jgi:hypothetical protein
VHEHLHAGAVGGVDEGVGADDVGAHELGAAVDGPVHMGLGGEVDHLVVLGHELADEVGVADVALHEREARVLADLVEVGGVAGVRELVEDGDRDVLRAVLAEDGAHVVGADEAGAAGHEDLGGHLEICTLL